VTRQILYGKGGSFGEQEEQLGGGGEKTLAEKSKILLRMLSKAKGSKKRRGRVENKMETVGGGFIRRWAAQRTFVTRCGLMRCNAETVREKE